MKVRMGELLVRAGVISEPQLHTALKEQRQWGGRIGDILVRMQYVTEDTFVRALSKQTGIARADLDQPIPPHVVAKIPGEVAEEYEVVPVELLEDGRTLVVATADPLNVPALDHLGNVSRCRVVPRVAGAGALRRAISRYYQGEELHEVGAEMRILDSQGMPVSMGAVAQAEALDPRALSLAPPPAGSMAVAMAAGMGGVLAPPGSPPAGSAPVPRLSDALPRVMATPLPPGMGGPLPPGGLAPFEPPPQPGMAPPAPYAAAPAWGYVPAPAPVPTSEQRLDVVEEAQRRETAALRALVEMLVEQGVIRLEDYLSRLRR